MSLLALNDHGGRAVFDAEQCRAAGATLRAKYVAAKPFPHVVIDDFIDPALLRTLLSGFPDSKDRPFFDRHQERFKYQIAPDDIPDPAMRGLLFELNSPAFLAFLEALTGIGGLISDPYFAGGGLHETRSGGHLSIHADFNMHERMKVERRLNLLIYLNDDWQPAWGGDLEMWDRSMSACRVKVTPALGRAVIFNTDADSYHGHPDPLACPPDRSRRSIATYYYTVPRSDGPARTTRFQVRPGSGDRADRRVAFDHFVQDWVPARLRGYARWLNPFR
ncbi:MAG: 2OG-Fe(II) oxygenase [Rhizorhabdus sp.]